METLYTNFRWGFDGERQEMLVRDGRVVHRGPGLRGEGVDLGGRWLMPSFIDAHCHILPTGLDLQKLWLGDCDSHEQVRERVAVRRSETPPGRWLQAVHYDQTRYPDGAHLTRYDLDQVCPDIPVLLRHASGHASIANTAALRAGGIREDEPDFPGGTFRRDASGVIDGVLLEHAHERVSAAAPKPTLDEMVDAILRAGEKMADLGIACASDMMTGRFDLAMELEAYRLAAERGCRIRTRLYIQWGALLGPRRLEEGRFQELSEAMDPDRCRVAGVKIFADGAIGAGTAAIYGSYEGAPPAATSGTLMYAPDRLNEMVRIADEAGYSLAIHSIGDYSTDLVMGALEATGNARRHRIEHAMILSDAQIERLARLDCHVTMQPEFLAHFGHSYLRQLGPERRARLKRARSVLDAGIRLSFSSDRPIVAGDPQVGIGTLTRRPDGYDQGENISPAEAWRGYTSAAAQANEDGEWMGSLEPGQLADFQLLDDDPIG